MRASRGFFSLYRCAKCHTVVAIVDTEPEPEFCQRLVGFDVGAEKPISCDGAYQRVAPSQLL